MTASQSVFKSFTDIFDEKVGNLLKTSLKEDSAFIEGLTRELRNGAFYDFPLDAKKSLKDLPTLNFIHVLYLALYQIAAVEHDNNIEEKDKGNNSGRVKIQALVLFTSLISACKNSAFWGKFDCPTPDTPSHSLNPMIMEKILSLSDYLGKLPSLTLPKDTVNFLSELIKEKSPILQKLVLKQPELAESHTTAVTSTTPVSLPFEPTKELELPTSRREEKTATATSTTTTSTTTVSSSTKSTEELESPTFSRREDKEERDKELDVDVDGSKLIPADTFSFPIKSELIDKKDSSVATPTSPPKHSLFFEPKIPVSTTDEKEELRIFDWALCQLLFAANPKETSDPTLRGRAKRVTNCFEKYGIKYKGGEQNEENGYTFLMSETEYKKILKTIQTGYDRIEEKSSIGRMLAEECRQMPPLSLEADAFITPTSSLWGKKGSSRRNPTITELDFLYNKRTKIISTIFSALLTGNDKDDLSYITKIRDGINDIQQSPRTTPRDVLDEFCSNLVVEKIQKKLKEEGPLKTPRRQAFQ